VKKALFVVSVIFRKLYVAIYTSFVSAYNVHIAESRLIIFSFHRGLNTLECCLVDVTGIYSFISAPCVMY